MRCIDLNCDLGEGAGHDAELMLLITSANIACGGHAGTGDTMRAAVELALRHGVAIGAHPGLEDRPNFGRKELSVTPDEARALVRRQFEALDRIARSCGARIGHVKLHGALYNISSRDAAVAKALASAGREADPQLGLFGLAGGELLSAGRACGLRVASEVFADRNYEPDGSLTPRSRPEATISDGTVAATRALRMIREGVVVAADGTRVAIAADTICVHGDGPHAVDFAWRLRQELTAGAILVRALHPG